MRARLRSDSTPDSAELELQVGDVVLDLRQRTVTCGGIEHELSAREFALLEVFLRRPGEVLSREELLNRVWNLGHNPGSNVVDVYVGYLRKKLGTDRIATVRGAGYRFVG